MTQVGELERKTQNRVIRLFQDALGYAYLGDWHDRLGNRNIEDGLLRPFLVAQGYDNALIDRALTLLHRAADDQGKGSLRSQPGRLRLAALRRQGQARRRRPDADRLADRLEESREQSLRHRRGSDGRREPSATTNGPMSCCTSTASPWACWN